MKLAYAVLNLLQGLFLAFWSVLCISLAFVVAALTLNREIPLVMARRLWAPPLIWASGARLRVDPLPDVDWSKPHVYVMNHQSMLDIACAFAVLPANLRFVGKHSLKYVPFIGWFMWMTGMIFIDRSNAKRAIKSLGAAGERIRAGANILMFPEGTRSRDGQILPFKKGPFVLALEAQVPIVPIAIEGSMKVAPRGSFAIRPGVVRMKVGAPIPTEGKSRREADAFLTQVHQTVVGLHRELAGAA